jgi:rubrerythrin
MSNSAAALRQAVEFEKKALEKYEEAVALVKHAETKESIEKIASEKKQIIESMHWVIMAEAGEIETEKPAPVAEGEEPKSGASKCPFSGALAEMGIDITKMSKEDAMEKMGDMSKLFPGNTDS